MVRRQLRRLLGRAVLYLLPSLLGAALSLSGCDSDSPRPTGGTGATAVQTPDPGPAPPASPTTPPAGAPGSTLPPAPVLGAPAPSPDPSPSPSPSPSPQPTPTPSPEPTPTPTPGPTLVTVTIGGVAGAASFAPSPVTVPAGSAIRWRNADAQVHTATQEFGFFDTGLIPPAATSAPIALDSPGTFTYRCAIHLTETGVLVVTR